MRQGILCGVLAAVGLAGFAAGQRETTLRWTTYAQGALTCAQWADARKQGGPSEAAARAWVSGFVTAAHYYHAMLSDVLAPLPDLAPRDQAAWVDTYCEGADDSRTLSNASRALVNNMVTRGK